MTTSLNEAARRVAGQYSRARLAPVWISFVTIMIDLPVITVALWFAQYASMSPEVFSPLRAALTASLCAVIAASLLLLGGRYDRHNLRRSFRSALEVIGGAMVPLAFLAVTGPDAQSDAFLTAGLMSLTLTMFPLRWAESLALGWLAGTGQTAQRAVIAGGGENAEQLIRAVSNQPGSDIQFCAIFDSRSDARSPAQILGIPNIGSFDDLITFVREAEIDLLIVALPLEAKARIKWLLKQFSVLPVEVRLSAFSENYQFNTHSDGLVSAIRRSFGPERRLTKRTFDLVFSIIALILVSPILLGAAIALRLDSPGPIFFRQRRYSYNDRIIDVFKFRSMYTDDCDPEARKIVTNGDARVTRVGRFLRKSSIDELPQLFNVIMGDLSLVGPRPHAVAARSSGQTDFTEIVDGYSARHRLPAGITGWAQINGWRGEIDDPDKLRKRVAHDLYYIENWSLWLDLKILLRTPLCLFNTSAAY